MLGTAPSCASWMEQGRADSDSHSHSDSHSALTHGCRRGHGGCSQPPTRPWRVPTDTQLVPTGDTAVVLGHTRGRWLSLPALPGGSHLEPAASAGRVLLPVCLCTGQSVPARSFTQGCWGGLQHSSNHALLPGSSRTKRR